MANPVAQIILTAVDRTKAAFASAKGGLTALGNTARSVSGLFAGLFAGLSTVFFVGQLRKAIDTMDDASKAAQAAGISVENLSALDYAGGQSGLKDGEMQKALSKLASSLDDARAGSGAAAEAFKRLQLDPTQFSDTDAALSSIADRFADMPDGINKTALAADFFGEKMGPRLIPLLNQGRAGIQALKDEAAALGVVLNGEAAKAAEQFNDNLDRLKKAGEGLGVQLANDMLPGLTQITDAMALAAKDGGLLNAAWVGLGGLGAALFTDDLLSNTQKLAKAQAELAKAAEGARRAGIGDTGYITRKRAEVKALEEQVAAEKRAEEERRKQSKTTAGALAIDNAEIVKARKEATNEQIADAERLSGALLAAFEASSAAEENYLKEARRLREEANAPDKPQSGDVEAQAAANLDAIARTMRLQREAASASLDDVQAQAEALRNLADALDNQEIKQEAIRQSKLAEATANERAAAEERSRYQGLAQQQTETARRAENLKAALEGIGKEVSVEIKPGVQTDAALAKLREIRDLVDYLATKPLNLNVSGAAATANLLRDEALKFGRRG